MQLTILGSNGTYPTAGRPASGYLLRTAATSLWIDAGSGTFAALQEFVDPLVLDAVVISHVHPDHSVDLLAFYHFARFGPRQRSQIPVLAADLVEERLAGFLAADADHPFRTTFEFRTVGDGDSAAVGDVELRFATTAHPVPTVALRASRREKSVVYTADTGPSPGLVELARGANVLVAEASYQGEEKPWSHHLTAYEAGQLAAEAGVERLFLTHIGPGLDPNRSLIEAESTFGSQVRAAIPGTTISI